MFIEQIHESDPINGENYLLKKCILVHTFSKEELIEHNLHNFNGLIRHYSMISKEYNFEEHFQRIYICGDISKLEHIKNTNINIVIIADISSSNINDDWYKSESTRFISKGQVPINIHNVGVFFPKFFDPESNFYELINDSHEFQDLGVGDKKGKAHRKGIYLTEVKGNDEVIGFNVLRCSTNLSGPTDNFNECDDYILEEVNKEASYIFAEKVKQNHVLAQTYHNRVDDNNKEKKAKISVHSDKTKDMPNNAIMSFCTFYKNTDKIADADPNIKQKGYDYVYKNNTTVLTKLRFKLKKEVVEKYTYNDNHASEYKEYEYEKQFDITLYPDSVFMMSLHTNRIYTHEIVPSNLPINLIPTRMGYVIRCSNTGAIYDIEKKQVFLVYPSSDDFVPLEQPTEEGLKKLKEFYRQENKTIDPVDYSDKFNFSMNTGDYKEPLNKSLVLNV
jgi:hypothetical protein